MIFTVRMGNERSRVMAKVEIQIPVETTTFVFNPNQPTVEYAPVVRCKNCEYWDRETVRQNSNDFKWWNEAICKEHSLIGVNEPHEMWVDADWFCADGERRSETDQ